MFGGGTGHYYQATFTVVTSQQVTISIETSTGTTIASATGTGTLSIIGALGTNQWLYGETKLLVLENKYRPSSSVYTNY